MSLILMCGWLQVAIALIFLMLIAMYLLVFLLPLNWIAQKVRLPSVSFPLFSLLVCLSCS